MISGIPPSKFKETEIAKLVEGMLERKTLFGKPLEYVAGKSNVWMPYYRIRMEYWRSREEPIGGTGQKMPAETALNAMFCGCVNGESELLMIFRPNYLRHEAVTIVPTDDEVVGPTSRADFQGILSGLVKKTKEVEDELPGLRSKLSKNYVRKRRFSMLLPVGNLRAERDLSNKIAKLEALRNTVSMCLNIYEEVGDIEVVDNDTFYYPVSVFSLRHRENETLRFLILNLVKAGSVLSRRSCDTLLTRLCNSNIECGKIVAAAVAGSSLSS